MTSSTKLSPRSRKYMGNTRGNKGFRKYLAEEWMGKGLSPLFIRAMKEKKEIKGLPHSPKPLRNFYP